MLPDLSIQLIVFLACVGAYTLAAAIWDIRVKRIPNKLTLPVFGLGLVYQLAFNQVDGLLAAGTGFAAGFGLLFLLWMIGSGGGGDVKLMGALGVWLGGKMTLMVLVASTVLAAFGTLFAIILKASSHGVWASKDHYLSTGKLKKGEKPTKETVAQKQKRRTMGYAVPVALATWMIVMWQLPKFPWMQYQAESQPVAAATADVPATE
ncbi:MAG: A24 family peptidase [Planctomycetota bacterium]|jgi:prepilin peptidase CpaA